jgi:hypothetical protein
MQSRRLLLPLALLSLLFVSTGCSSFPAWKGKYTEGSILVLPPRDVVQEGQLHEKSPGSGRVLLDAVKSRLVGQGWQVIETDDPRFTHSKTPDPTDAVAEGARLGSKYVLVMELGEFRNAAPMTFRNDFATLSTGIMYDVETGEPVWRLTKPLYRKKGNVGNHLGLVANFGDQVGRSIVHVPK